MEAELTYPHHAERGLPRTRSTHSPPSESAQRGPADLATSIGLPLGALGLGVPPDFWPADQASFPPCQPHGPSEPCSRSAQPHQCLPDSRPPSCLGSPGNRAWGRVCARTRWPLQEGCGGKPGDSLEEEARQKPQMRGGLGPPLGRSSSS